MQAPAWMSKPLPDGRIHCTACAQSCIMKEGEFGICGIREVKDGKLWLNVYGIASAVNIDPVEKKPLYHFLPGTEILSVGTVGCNFSCIFCQNADISQYPKEHNHQIFGSEASPESLVDAALKYGCQSIAYTYNEPAVFFEYAYDTAKLATEKGLKNVFVTSGYETKEAIDKAKPYLHAMNIDIKAFREDFYKDICGSHLKPVLTATEHAYKSGIWVEITTLVIEGKNDSDEELRGIAEFIKNLSPNIPWHISAFRPMYKMQGVPPTSGATLRRAYDIGKAAGLHFVYVGNYADTERLSTYCPSCGYRCITRHGHLGDHVNNELKNGHCPKCSFEIQGVWS